eukprot:m.1422625 g.1422625  ORF g.1422625 m.1422625 type:complete len:75 (-) comp25052_c1_seq1:19-243(-)
MEQAWVFTVVGGSVRTHHCYHKITRCDNSTGVGEMFQSLYTHTTSVGSTEVMHRQQTQKLTELLPNPMGSYFYH